MNLFQIYESFAVAVFDVINTFNLSLFSKNISRQTNDNKNLVELVKRLNLLHDSLVP